MAYESKYGRITTERGSLGEDEPAFLIRAQDRLACPAVSAYHELCKRAGSPQEHLDGIERAYTAIADWQEAHPYLVHTPDSASHESEEH
jgi:hypothetical protein